MTKMNNLRDKTRKRLFKCVDESINAPIYLLAINVIDAHTKATQWADENNLENWQFNEITIMPGTFVNI